MKLTLPVNRGNPAILSEGAKAILRHFRHTGAQQLAYEYPATLAELFPDAQGCEAAQLELQRLGLVELAPELPRHIPVPNRIRAAAITLEGLRFIEAGELDD